MLAASTALLAFLAASGSPPPPADAAVPAGDAEVASSTAGVPGGDEVASPDGEVASTSSLSAAPAPPAPMTPLVAHSNETMEFSVSYLGITMGKARILVGKVEPTVAPVFLQAATSSVLSFITLKQHFASYLDLETGLPRSATLDAIEGSYRHTDTTQFDRAANKATVRVKGKYDNTYDLDVPPGTVDFIGLVFKLRSLPLEPGDRHEFAVLAGRRLKTVTAEVVARETISTKAGDFRTVKVRVPTGLTGKFSEKNPSHIWLSDDARRIVIRITTDFAVGHATAGLVSYTPGVPPAEAGGLPPGATARP